MHVHIISFIFASTIIIHLYQCSVLGGKHWDGNLKTPEEVAVRMTRGTLHAACYDHCYVIHAIFVLYNGKCSFHQPFLRYEDYYKSDLLWMDSQRALLWVSNYCHEACKCILLYLVIIKNSHINNEFRSSSTAKRTKFYADNLKRNMRASWRIWKRNWRIQNEGNQYWKNWWRRQQVTGSSGLGVVSHRFLMFWRVFLCFKRKNM